MNSWWLIPIAGCLNACAAWLGIRLATAACRKIVPFDDGPQTGRPPAKALVVGAAILGAVLAWHDLEPAQFAMLCFLTISLAACWASDVLCGIVPDVFTLVPLAVVLGIALFERNFAPALAAAVVFVPFALAAWYSHGRGMGWGDVKLVALGGAALGLQSSILAFAAACLAAVVVALVRKRRHEPLAFAPYLAATIAIFFAIPGASTPANP